MLRRSRLASLAVSAAMSVYAGAAGAAVGTVMDFARRGPLWKQVEQLAQPPSSADWEMHGADLVRQLTCSKEAAAPTDLDPAIAARVYHLYLPIYFFMRDRLSTHQRDASADGGRSAVATALAVGLSAPQGCGKTTLVDLLVDRFAADGHCCVAVSIDDFYLPGAAQDELATSNPSNPLFQVRGNAGTHDLPLGGRVLRELKREREPAPGAVLRIPQYDKAARAGRGDRAPESTWPEAPRADVVLLEGWMAGFAPLADDAPVLSKHDGLDQVNDRLSGYSEWHDLMDAWVVLGVDDPNYVYEWRLQVRRPEPEPHPVAHSDALSLSRDPTPRRPVPSYPGREGDGVCRRAGRRLCLAVHAGV